MGWNNSSERQRFEKAQRRQAKKYKELGMTDEQIRAMYEFDLKQFRSDRRFYSHTVLLEKDWSDSSKDSSDEKPGVIISTIDAPEGHSRFWWIEEFEDERIAHYVRLLSESDRELLSMCMVDDLSHVEITSILGISRQAVDKRFKKIEELLKTGSRKRVFAG